MDQKISVILLAGGIGSRMGSATPKQFLPLKGKPIAFYSLEILLSLPQIHEIVVVCAEEYRSLFSAYPVRFASPGEKRQESVFNGLCATSAQSSWICTHDAARPLITKAMVEPLFHEGFQTGAAALGVPMKSTVKECCSAHLVQKTLDRDRIWEIQTPQFLSKKILCDGFSHINSFGIDVTDDVSIAELMHQPVRMVKGCPTNIKITTPEDLILASHFLELTKKI